MRDGRPLADQPGIDLSGLMDAEAAVAALGSPMQSVVPDERPAPDARTGPPAIATPEVVQRVSARLEELSHTWRALEDGGAITLSFATRTG